MEVDFIDGSSVDTAFSLCNVLINCRDVLFYSHRKGKRVDSGEYFLHAVVFMCVSVSMLMLMRVVMRMFMLMR